MVEIELKPEKKQPNWLAGSDPETNGGHYHWRISGHPMAWRPPTDLYITEKAIVVRLEIAGMRDGEFIITLENQVLTIRGTRPDYPEQRAYHQMEIRFGEFRSDIELHWPVDADNIEAEYQDGFLRLVLPKAQPHNIEIQE